MSESTVIRGKVARILTSRQLALNIGEQNGVTIGMKFDVLDPKGEEIKDPETGEVLGSINRPKVRVRIVQVEPRISVAETYRSKTVNLGGTATFNLGAAFSRLLMPPEWVDQYETLRTNEKTWDDLDESESYVKSGDPVVQVLDDDEEGPEIRPLQLTTGAT